MKVKKCKSCGELFAGNTDKCSDCINREEKRAKDLAQLLLFLAMAIAWLVWYLPKFIHKKVGMNGVIMYFAVLAILGFAGYFYYNEQHSKTIRNTSSHSASEEEISYHSKSKLQTQITQQAYKPSFDCAKAQAKTEIAICGNSELAGMDFQMVQLYNPLASSFKENQIEWLKERNKCGGNIDCLKSKYKARIMFLESQLAISAEEDEDILELDPRVLY